MTATLEAPASVPGPDDAEPPHPRRPAPAQLARWQDPRPLLGWLMTAFVTLVAGFTRFWALGSPPGANTVPKNGMLFDEVYYAVEAQELLRYGYEDNRGYMFVVHPPLGKWLIAASEWLVGGRDSTENLTNSLGWRIAPAVVGTLVVVLVARTVRRMMHSNLFGGVAGLLMALEGLSVVLSRTAILDIFLQFFVVAAFAALVVDRDAMRARLAGLVADGVDLAAGTPSLGPRPWRLVGGVMLGLSCAVKWSASSFLVLFVIMSLVWDRAAFRSAGVRHPTATWAHRSLVPAVGSLVVAPIAAYLFTWLGWFTGENSWNRHWADTHSSTTHSYFGRLDFWFGWIPGPIRSLAAYHLDAYRFHEQLDSPHSYQSNPWSWLVLGRPVDFYYNGAEKTCGAKDCSREVLLIGTPLLWWAFVPMLLWLAWHWFSTRDWRAGAVWFAFAAGWLVWFQNLDRTMFLFYMAPLVPFLVIGLTLALGVMWGPAVPVAGAAPPARAHAARRRRLWGAAGVAGYLALVVADFAWMWPIFTGGLLTYDDWHAHMWLPSWV
ncbi:C-terminal four TMM region of protein-O-mannosyltransferase [Jatrophihabitans endophyticus]|uniref:Polyprenol-phosphate-mannose--protein mannosyltransferase n=1 Tax=Jatrophihabitans endophyticus TaxID=1206085 RepID=A0A1M5U2F2_9ACTN|nr:phospholipid carrier-dependent glycosyltransferase [Jatrophihabitans endophyticus]SHH57026.1 C-terminal four TMM region of protein-O-mannosyltransferase [Jatrophihabitans endophyticus]